MNALVTGGGRGIGRAIAVALAQAGWNVAVNYREDAAAARHTAAQVQAAGREALALQADVADLKQAKALLQHTIDAFGRLELLVNNAGVALNMPLALMAPEDVERILQIDLLAVMQLTRLAARAMAGQGGGCIVNLSSSGARRPGLGQAAYSAAKGGVEAFTRAAAIDLAPLGVRVCAVAPGVTNTDMAAPMREHLHDALMRRLLVKRFAEPQEIARAVVHLAGAGGRALAGETVHVDGGMKMV